MLQHSYREKVIATLDATET